MHSPLRSASRPTIAAAAALLALTLLGACASPAPAPADPDVADPADTSDVTEETPSEEAEGSPYGTWSQALDTQLQQLDTWHQAWTADSCTVEIAISASGPCRQLVTTAQLSNAALAEVFSSRGDAPDEVVEQLDAIESAVDEAVTASEPWNEQQCMWEMTDECAAPAEAVIDSVLAIHDAAKGWSA